jgi:hypothetical protein
MKAPAIPMRRSPRFPNAVPCTIWPASQHLRCLQLHQQADEFSSGSGDASPVKKTGVPKVTIRLFKEEGNHSLRC